MVDGIRNHYTGGRRLAERSATKRSGYSHRGDGHLFTAGGQTLPTTCARTLCRTAGSWSNGPRFFPHVSTIWRLGPPRPSDREWLRDSALQRFSSAPGVWRGQTTQKRLPGRVPQDDWRRSSDRGCGLFQSLERLKGDWNGLSKPHNSSLSALWVFQGWLEVIYEGDESHRRPARAFGSRRLRYANVKSLLIKNSRIVERVWDNP